MNREIKFRIWADNKFYNKCLVGNTNNSKSDEWTCLMVWLEKTKEWVHCDNGFICQFTGLHDKNGKEIYEGDIIRKLVWNEQKYMETNNGQCYSYAKIAYIEKLAGFYIVNNEGKICWELGHDKYDIEVCGNIYENPELLGGE